MVSSLNTADLEAGKKHLLYFRGVQMSTGQYWYVSVIVAKGAKPGKRITLTSGVHGDEMSSVHTVQTVMGRLDAAEMSGTVMAVLDIARPAMESMQRRWPSSGRGFELADMNREWPGNENGVGAVSRQAGLVFNRLLKPNTDLAIDFHTGTTGLDVSSFHIGDMSIPEVKTMMMLYPSRQYGTTRSTLACFTTPTSMPAFLLSRPKSAWRGGWTWTRFRCSSKAR